MRAARFHAQKDVRIEDVPEPVTRPGTAKIKVAWCGICGTDLHECLEGPIFIPGRIALDELITKGFDTLIHHNDTAVKILVHP
jgi:hypothetical protein